MNITDLLLGQENNSAIGQLAQKLGVSEEQARAIVAEVTPSLSRGMQRRAEDKGDNFGGLFDALGSGNHSRYVEQPDLLGRQETIDDGNSILGHIFGNKDVSRNVARNAEQSTGIAGSLIKKALPMVAAMVMGSLGKQIFGGGSQPSAQQGGGLLTSLLDSDRDGSMIDDVLGMAFKMAFR
ncbi:MAG: DUF937 domain-containing protein [Thiolinea sp.]